MPHGVIERSQRLAPEPASAARARRLVAEALEEGGRAALGDTAMLLVSELVTNAVLHAGTEIGLHCVVKPDCVRVEVSDRSPIKPGIRHYDPFAMTGRGLALVARMAADWGVDERGPGKTVWFVLQDAPGAESSEPDPTPTVEARGKGPLAIQLRRLPVGLVRITIQHGDALLRELALLAVAGRLPRDIAVDWRTPRIDITPLLSAAEDATLAGHTAVDVELRWPEGAGQAAMDRLALVEEADRLARDGVLLSPPSLPEIAACRRWLFTQINDQANHQPPVPWEPPTLDPDGASAFPAPWPELDEQTGSVLVADSANRLVFVTDEAAETLGWDRWSLVGRRLTTIIPPELREAHLAAFSRYQLTGEPRVLGRRLQVPALRRDGSRVQVELMIEAVSVPGRRQAFRATLKPVEAPTV